MKPLKNFPNGDNCLVAVVDKERRCEGFRRNSSFRQALSLYSSLVEENFRIETAFFESVQGGEKD